MTNKELNYKIDEFRMYLANEYRTIQYALHKNIFDYVSPKQFYYHKEFRNGFNIIFKDTLKSEYTRSEVLMFIFQLLQKDEQGHYFIAQNTNQKECALCHNAKLGEEDWLLEIAV